MRINSNIPSLNAQNQLQRTEKAIARSLQRLSTGQRVNSPRDDAAAFSMGVKFTSQIRGLAAANLGMNLALGMIETADGAISTQLDIVQRMREIAVQAANGTLLDADRANLNLEVQSLLAEYNRITTDTNFNSIKLLDGSFSTINIQAGANQGNTIGLNVLSTQASGIFIRRQTTGDGTFQNRTTVALGGSPRPVYLRDLNGDGVLDLISGDTGDNTLSILLGNGNGTFRTRTTLATGSSPYSVISVDLNGDGFMDLVNSDNTDATASVFLGNGNGTFQTRTTIATGLGPRAIIANDVNGDGRLDLISNDRTDNTLSIAIGNGNGTFQSRVTLATGATPSWVAAGDINNDGRIDLVNSDTANTTDGIFLGNGNGTFQARTTLTTNSNPDHTMLVDLNADGKLDLLTTWSTSATLGIYLGNGNGSFGSLTTISTGIGANYVTAGDINGDGRIDLLTTDGAQGTLSMYLGNGNGTFRARTTQTVGTTPMDLMLGDLNGDGASDVVTVDSANNTASILIGNTQIVSSSSQISVATRSNAEIMIGVFDNAIANLNSNRSNLSAIHSRLESSVAANLLQSESLSEARSNALDVDYSLEVAELVRNQILQEAQVAVLAQANLQMELVRKLFE